MFSLDTNTLIYFFKGQGNVKHHLLNVPPSDIYIPSVVVYELEYGLNRSISPNKRREQLNTFLNHVCVGSFDNNASRIAGKIKHELAMHGNLIGPHDILIAAETLSQNKTLVTRNISEFSRVNSLSLVNWY